jgi:hypothetical protein
MYARIVNLPRKSARTIHREQDASSNISFVVACTHIFLDNPAPRDKLGAATASEVLVQYKPYHYAVAVLSMLIFGFSFVWIKVALLGYRPLAIVFVRLVLAGVLLDLLLRAQGRNLRIQPGDHKWFALMAFFEPFVIFWRELGHEQGIAHARSVISASSRWLRPCLPGCYCASASGMGIAGLLVCFLGVLATVWERAWRRLAVAWGDVHQRVLGGGLYLVVKSRTGRYSPLFIVKSCARLPRYTLPAVHCVRVAARAGFAETPGAAGHRQMSLLAAAVAYICLTATIRRMG